MILQHKYHNLEGPEPKQCDVPRPRPSIASHGSRELLDVAYTLPPEDATEPPPTAEGLARQESNISEMELLEVAGTIGVVRLRSVVLYIYIYLYISL